MSLLTKKKQSPLQLGDEFILAMKQMKPCGADGEALFDHLVQLERSGKIYPEIENQVVNLQSTMDLTNIDVIKNTGINVSHMLLLYIGKQSSAIPEYCNTMVGLYATVFYSQYDKSYPLTLEWVGNQVGKGKIVGFRQFFPWASCSRDDEGVNIFTYMKKEDMFTYQPEEQ